MALYQSEITQFLTQLRADRPHLAAEQRKGRDIWWDREPLDLNRTWRNLQSRVAQHAYPYQPMTGADLKRNHSNRGDG